MKDLPLTMILKVAFSNFLKTLFIITFLMIMILMLNQTMSQELSGLLVLQKFLSLFLMSLIHGNLLLSLKSKSAEKLYSVMSVDLYATNMAMITDVDFYFLMKLLNLPITIMIINLSY